MKIVSAAKYNRAEKELRSARPYGQGAQGEWAVPQKMQNPGSPNEPPMVDGWVVRLSSG